MNIKDKILGKRISGIFNALNIMYQLFCRCLERNFHVRFFWCDRLYYCDSGGYGYHAGAGNRILFPEQREKECNEGGCF